MTFSTTEFSVEDIDQPTTKDETATTQIPTEEKGGVPVPISESKLTLILSAVALGISLIALAILVHKILNCTMSYKKDPNKVKPENEEVS